MRILLVHQYFQEEDGAGGTRFNEMSRFWKEMGHEVVVITGNLSQRGTIRKDKYKGKFVSLTFQNNIEVWRCFVSKKYNKNFLGRLWGYLSFVLSSIYAGVFKVKGKFDIIIVTSPPLFIGLSALAICFFKRTPLLFEVRDLWPESAIDTGVITNKHLIKYSYKFEKYLYKKAKLINVLTPAFYRILNEEKHISTKKLLMIPNAADFDISEKLLSGFDVDSFKSEKKLHDSFNIIYMGAHGVANHLEQIIETAVRLQDTNVKFILIGDGMKKKHLVKMSQDMNLTNVEFIAPLPKNEVLKYVLAADMGVSVLKKSDTFKTIYSNKTFDYMSCKKPVLMVIDGVSRDLIEEADCGIFIEPENIKDFENKIRYYLHNQDELIRQGENGYEYAKKYFDREVLAKKYINNISEYLNLR